MYTQRVYRIRDMVKWTRYETLFFLLLAIAYVIIYDIFGVFWMKIPWTPLALIGTAVAFVIGFQNNAAYGRIWEARKIWGGIVNVSRTFGMYLQDTLTNEYTSEKWTQEGLDGAIRICTYRHIAWLHALRHAMRQKKSWETVMEERTNREWHQMVPPPEKGISLEEELRPYLSEEEWKEVSVKDNKAVAILYQQSRYLRQLKEQGIIWEFSFLELESLIREMFEFQGKSERIKNFPYPRHFASLNYYFMWVFILLLPLGMIPQFAEQGQPLAEHFPLISKYFVWFSVPFYVAVAWVFHTMERIGRTGENPFEGSANDVPISTISRGIEIDLRQNLGEPHEEIPRQFAEIYGVQM